MDSSDYTLIGIFFDKWY